MKQVAGPQLMAYCRRSRTSNLSEVSFFVNVINLAPGLKYSPSFEIVSMRAASKQVELAKTTSARVQS